MKISNLRKVSFLVFILLLILFLVRIGLAVYLWKKADGLFVILRGDGMSTVLSGYLIQNSDFFYFFIRSFCPLAPCLYAQGFKLCPDIFLVPSVINTILGLGSLVFLFLLSKILTGDRGKNDYMVGLLSVGITIFYPVFIWTTLAGDRNSSMLFCILMGLFFYMGYLKWERKILLLLAAFAFMFSSSAMHDGWIFTSVFALVILKEILITYRNSRKIEFSLMACILISFSFIFIHLYMDYQRYGSPLGFLVIRHNAPGTSEFLLPRIISYPSLIVKAFIYPVLQLFLPRPRMYGYPFIIEWMALLSFIPILIILIILVRKGEKLVRQYALFIIYLLIVTVLLSIIGMGAVCDPLPERTLFNYFSYVPLFSFVINKFILRFISVKLRIQFVSIISIILLISCINIIVSLNPTKSQMRKETIQLGLCIKSLYSEGVISSMDKILLEQRVEAENFSIAIEPHMLQIFAPEKIQFDREWKTITREDGVMICTTKNNPSILEYSISKIQDYLKEKEIRVVIVRTDVARSKIDKIMKYVINIGEYHIYLFPEDEDLIRFVKDRTKQLPVPWLGRRIEEPPFG